MFVGFVLIVGVLLMMVIAAVVFAAMGMKEILGWLLPLAPMLIAIGSFLLIAAESLLFLGGREDRKAALKDLSYLAPTCLVSLGLWWLAQYYMW